ncbi:MAG: endonuclease III [Nanoarchaeota archaeon]|nr:endonuclease III [Nanoarchaeota archaeon]
MKDSEIGKVYNILRKETLKYDSPVAEVIEVRTNDAFKVLVSAMLSTQTRDEITMQASMNLFKKLKKPKDFDNFSQKQLESLIYPVSFYRNKARFLKQLPKYLANGVPDEINELLKIPGVGRKIANLVVSVAFDKDGICVDTHVHRILNRLGYVKTKNPKETEMVLRQKLPKKYWGEINAVLVTYGQNHCKPISPYCSTCKVFKYCERKGVNKSR